MKDTETKLLKEISKKLNVLISLSIRILRQDTDFSKKRKHGFIGDLAGYLDGCGLDYNDISKILGARPESIGVLVRRKRQRK